MGVPGLWEAVSKAGVSRSLANLAVVDGFEGNKSGKRAYRVGIDASIWYFSYLQLSLFLMNSICYQVSSRNIFQGWGEPRVAAAFLSDEIIGKTTPAPAFHIRRAREAKGQTRK